MTTLFVSTTGGHLAELESLGRRLPPTEGELWVTHDNAQSRALLAGRDVHFVPYVGVRRPHDVLRCLPDAVRLRRSGVTRAISTGSGIALGYLPYLAARGVECHYIESAARVAGPSLTGRVLQHIPAVRCYTQYPGWSGPRWAFSGNIFDRYTAGPPRAPGTGPVRVVVTVGTAVEYPFTRLVTTLTPLLARDGELARATGRPVEVLWQTGCTPAPGHDVRPFLGADELAAACARADVVIGHAGLGTTVTALEAGRAPVLAVRRTAAGEAGDDHQAQLGHELTRRGLAVVREADAVVLDDLLHALDAGVVPAAQPAPFTLN